MPIAWHRDPRESVDYDPPRFCVHGIDLARADCGQCLEDTDYDSPFYRPVGEQYPDGAYTDPDISDDDMTAALAARFERNA